MLDEIGLPWRDTREALAARYGVQSHRAYGWDVVETPGRPVDGLLWPLSAQLFPGFSPHLPAGRFSSAISFGADARENIKIAAEQMGRWLGKAGVERRYNTLQCEWRSGAAAVRLTSWPSELQTAKLANPAHDREPRLASACSLEIQTGFRLQPTDQEQGWLHAFAPFGSVRGDRRMTMEAVKDLSPPESQVEFVREPEPFAAATFGWVGAPPGRQALIYCHTQLYLIPADKLVAFKVERMLPAKGGGGSRLVAVCLTDYTQTPRKELTVTDADDPEALNTFGAELAAIYAKPFTLGDHTYDV